MNISDRQVKIIVIGIQTNENGKEKLTSSCDGLLRTISGDSYLIYTEQIDGVEEPVENIISIGAREITIKKSGGIQTQMRFVVRKQTEFLYKTMYGDIPMEIYTDNLFIECDAKALHIIIDYKLMMGTVLVNECQMDISATSI